MLDGEEWAISVALAGEQECSTLYGLIFIKPHHSRNDFLSPRRVVTVSSSVSLMNNLVV